MSSPSMTCAQANLELALLSAEAEATSSSDIYAWLRESGLPSEAALRLKGLVDFTMDLGGYLVTIGKIVVVKVIAFTKAHPNLAAGIAVGAAVGVLASTVPVLGPYLWPITTLAGVSIGAIAGHRLDKQANGKTNKEETNLIAIAQDVIEIAREFVQLIIEIFTTVLNQKSPKEI